MFPYNSLPETQAALELSIFFASFVYEDGATLLAATLSASGRLDPRIGLLTAFLGIWIGDIGLYGLGSVFGRHTMQFRLAAEVPEARITGQGRSLVFQTRIAGLSHELRFRVAVYPFMWPPAHCGFRFEFLPRLQQPVRLSGCAPFLQSGGLSPKRRPGIRDCCPGC